MGNTPTHSVDLTAMAEELFNIAVGAGQMLRQNRQAGRWNLSVTEYLTLDLLSRHGTMTVGRVLDAVYVLPTQMSRIVRALERHFDAPLIECCINANDKRKIDLTLTATGRAALTEFRAIRLAEAIKILANMTPRDATSFVRIVRKIRSALAQSAGPGEGRALPSAGRVPDQGRLK